MLLQGSGAVDIGMWDLPGSGIQPASLASAGGFFTTEPTEAPSLISR